ncbi:heptaprenyl diphosphate synthase component 1 [Calditerricola satsumensis]|uniref:heptaprenyl diphosphate synthase component 1 n=1 Tax=Calditerricola satsumensis TaxID=373054 RepID=UPI0006D18423|nr:heptaprenyl diphosphate synthase component 1 [Calditerricola satsumensis]
MDGMQNRRLAVAFQAVLKQVSNLWNHPLFAHAVDKPLLPAPLAYTYFLFLHTTARSDEAIARRVIPLCLVQLGLAAHDAVDRTACPRARQLTVLAGDYASSLYYALLAQMDDIALIRTLARAIERINAWKVEMAEAFAARTLTAERYRALRANVDATCTARPLPRNAGPSAGRKDTSGRPLSTPWPISSTWSRNGGLWFSPRRNRVVRAPAPAGGLRWRG